MMSLIPDRRAPGVRITHGRTCLRKPSIAPGKDFRESASLHFSEITSNLGDDAHNTSPEEANSRKVRRLIFSEFPMLA